jgi:hypothetical protein
MRVHSLRGVLARWWKPQRAGGDLATNVWFVWSQRLAVLFPVAVLCVASITSIAGLGAGSSPPVVASADPGGSLPVPEGTIPVPEEAIEAPTSLPADDGLGLGVAGDTQQIIATSSTNGIPAAALAAYQRAESVINSADTDCNLTWQLIAAIGRVESNHGRYGDNALDDNGVAQPGIYGVALDGSNNTSVIRDTDAGEFDNDRVYDRAVGPMQFIPSTWSVVGVDADGDGQRDPQDIDDAALATSVYLCSGYDDLATPAGQRTAVYRYNHSQAYVDLVLSIMEAYLDGDFASIPNNTTAAGLLVPEPPDLGDVSVGRPDEITSEDGGLPADSDTEETATEQPDRPVDTPEGPGNGPGQEPGAGLGAILSNLPSTVVEPIDTALTLTQATLHCALEGLNALLQPRGLRQCIGGQTTS